MRTVSEVSALTGVTVRALHHYDEIGLLRPSDRSPAGYRLYGDDEVERLHEVLLWRELGFGLDEIADLLDDPAHDRLAALCRQRDRLVARPRRLDAMLAAVDAAIAARGRDTAMTDDEIRAIFGADADLFGTGEYAREAHERWGDTDAWRESATAYYERRAPGLAAYVRDAIHAAHA